jgi:cytochrome P450
MTDSTVIVTRHADVTAALNDPHWVVVPAPEASDTGIDWLRAHVSRFSTGDVHARRRAMAQARLAEIDPNALRRRASELSTMDPAQVTATVLAEALGIPPGVAPLIAAIAPSYFPGSEVPDSADDAVRQLVAILGGRFDENNATTIGLLVQAHDATGGLVTNTLVACREHDGTRVEQMLTETLRYDPPVRHLRRVCATDDGEHPPGTRMELDIAAANRDPDVFAEPARFDPDRPDAQRHLTFGAGIRPCPGSAHALAIAAGIVEGRRGGR